MSVEKNASSSTVAGNADSAKRPNILIAVAAYNLTIYTNCFRSILESQAALTNAGAKVSIREFSDPLIQRARNEMVAAFLAEPSYTHLLMVDADTGFEPKTILRMINFNKDVIGGAYPRRHFDFERVKDKMVKDPKKLAQMMMSFVLTPEYRDKNQLDIVKGFVRAKYVGTGCLLIRREALERMSRILAYTRIKTDKRMSKKEEPYLYGFFETMQRGRDGTYLAEDYAFCERWAQDCAGEIWCDVMGRYTHNGPSMFDGSWTEAMSAQGNISSNS